MRQYLPFLIAALGLIFFGVAMMLRNGTADANTVITNITSTFMMAAGAICLLGGVVTFFLRDDETVW